MLEAALRIASLCLLLACAEMLHGIARIRLLVPRVGKIRAQKISIVTGTLLAYAICQLTVPSLGWQDTPPLLWLGLGLSAFMASFDIAVGRFLMRRQWTVIARDFNPALGNYLVFGLMALLFIPWLTMQFAAS